MGDTCEQYPWLKESIPELIKKLPYEILVLLFSWLSIWDLISVRRVCHSWRVAAQDKSLWKNSVLTVNGDNRVDEINVKLMPLLKYIYGDANNSLLNVILENVIELSKLNVEFIPQILSSQVTLVLEKYPKLKSITLSSYDVDIFNCLEKLKTSKYLNEVDIRGPLRTASLSARNIFNIFTDCNNFPALTHLNVISNRDLEWAFQQNVIFRDIVTDIITKRSHQLLSLKLNVGHLECSDILESVSSCVKLQTLHISILPSKAEINIQRLSELRSLHVYAFRRDKCFNTALLKSLEKQSWEFLTDVDIYLYSILEEYNAAILRVIITNVKQLEMLEYTDHMNLIAESNLKHVSNLQKLEILSVCGLQNVSEEVIRYISKCRSLKKVELGSSSSNILSKDRCIIEMLHQLNNLKYVLIKVGDFYGRKRVDSVLHLESKEQIKAHIQNNLNNEIS